MGGNAQAPGGRTRQPGSAGLRAGLTEKRFSLHNSTLRYHRLAEWTTCTEIYFDTAMWDLRPDARSAVVRTARTARTLMLHDWRLELRCSGHADVRHTPEANKKLSEKRLRAVEMALHALLDHLKLWTLSTGEAVGKAGASNSPLLWAKDRRVDIEIKVEAEDERAKRQNPWIKARADIFRRYSPVYTFWVKYGLDYLIDQYEVHDQESYPVKIKPSDLNSVLDVCLALARNEDVAYLAQIGTQPGSEDIISDIYCVEYRRAYNEAYSRYQASPHYGSLSPPE